MQFIDLSAQQSLIRENLDQRIKKILDHGKYIMGPEVFELEEKLADYVGVKHCISCSSGTDALLIPLIGSLSAFIVGLLSLQALTWIGKKASFTPFGIYTLILGTILIISGASA